MSRLRFYIYTVGWFFRISFRIKQKGRENIPDTACLMCSNHTSMMDPVVMILAMGKKAYMPTKVMGKAELSKIPFFKRLVNPFVIFIDRGKSDMGAIKESVNCLKDGGRLIVFPEGRRVSEGDETQAKTGVSLMAVKGGSQLLPVYITACRKPLFRFKKVEVIFGEPYYPKKAEGVTTSEAYRLIADELMEKIEQLGKDAEWK